MDEAAASSRFLALLEEASLKACSYKEPYRVAVNWKLDGANPVEYAHPPCRPLE
jgi:hypothetical protein